MSVVINNPPLLSNLRVTSPYGMRSGSMHHGTDFGNEGNLSIVSVAPGVVARTAYDSDGYGYYTVIDHGEFCTLYGHMTSNLLKEGQRVESGTLIGMMGNTGQSTGVHLHFEIRLGNYDRFWSTSGNNSVNPMDYLRGVPAASGTTTSGYLVSYENSVPFNPTQIIGRRLSSLATQPLHAYVEISIGDKILSSSPPKPNILQRFEITRLEGVGDTASFVIFDDNWEEIESTFSDHWTDVNIQYGYVDSSLVSERYSMALQNYSIAFNSTGVLLTVEAISVGTIDNLTPRTIENLGKNPTEAIKKICRSIGLVVIDENFEKTLDADEEFHLINDHPIAYILEDILPHAINEKGEILTFNYGSDRRAYLKEQGFDISAGEKAVIRTYIYQKGYDSVVQDLTFDIKGVFGGSTKYSLASGAKSVFIDPNTKEELSHQEDSKTTSTVATGEYQHLNSSQSIPLVDSAGYNESQVKSRLYYKIKKSLTEMYEANMTIIGDPTIKLLDYIRIINVTDEGFLHHTSGIYQVTGITDTIDNGVMYTSLKLVRNGDINDGVELINAKVVDN